MKDEHLSNRDKKLKPKGGKGWCICDKVIVHHYDKCPNCGRRNGRKRFKR